MHIKMIVLFTLNPEAWYVANGGFQGTKIMIDEMKAALEK